MNRPRKKGCLVATTSNNELKQAFAKKNREHKVRFSMTVLGVKKYITQSEYFRLLNAGYRVEIEA